ncbi:MAG: hypothetical protein WDA16_02045 [Candidatus Thermoplasmatota archaeon]
MIAKLAFEDEAKPTGLADIAPNAHEDHIPGHRAFDPREIGAESLVANEDLHRVVVAAPSQ